MAGIILYLLTLLLETISVVVRFALVNGLVALLAGPEAGLAVGAAAALGPPVYSLLVLAGLPSGHMLVRQGLGARRPSPAELEQIERALAPARAAGAPTPRRIFTIPEEGLNAAISGRTLYVYQELYDSAYLPAVLAHELGHYNSSDGRLLLAIRALTIPGGFLIAWALLWALRWVVYGVASLLLALLLVIFVVSRVRLDGLTRLFFGAGVSLTRMLIIFAVGGVGPSLLGSLWRSYFVEREYAADAYAGRLGYANDLIAFFENEVLNDVLIPWQSAPTHPPATRRVFRLRQLAAAFRQRSPGPPGPPSPAQVPAVPSASPRSAAGFVAGQPGRGPIWPWTLAATAALIAVALAGALALGGLRRPPLRDSYAPTPGPTPTLGMPQP